MIDLAIRAFVDTVPHELALKGLALKGIVRVWVGRAHRAGLAVPAGAACGLAATDGYRIG